jgi:hypothetical protein
MASRRAAGQRLSASKICLGKDELDVVIAAGFPI